MFYYLLVFASVLGITLMDSPLLGGGWTWDLWNGIGFVAFTLILALFGDSGRGKRLAIHRLMGWTALGLVLAHALGFLFTDPVLLEYLDIDGPLYFGAGVVAAFLLLFVILSSGPQQRTRWLGRFKIFHWLGAVGVATTALYHIIGSGFYLQSSIAKVTFITLTVAYLVLPRTSLRSIYHGDVSAQLVISFVLLTVLLFVVIRAF